MEDHVNDGMKIMIHEGEDLSKVDPSLQCKRKSVLL